MCHKIKCRRCKKATWIGRNVVVFTLLDQDVQVDLSSRVTRQNCMPIASINYYDYDRTKVMPVTDSD